MRTPFVLTTSTRSRHLHAKHFAEGGSLPHYVQNGTGFFGNLFSTVKRIAMPVLKSVGRAALPIASKAISTALTSEGTVKSRMKAAAQSAMTKNNLMNLGRAAVRPIL